MKNVFFTMALLVMITVTFAADKTNVNLKTVVAVEIGCGEAGNNFYDEIRANDPDLTHREARQQRRSFVRWCRGL